MSWLLSHRIDPAVAKAAGVSGTLGGKITFRYRTPGGKQFYRTRTADGKMYQPKGIPLCLYWPLGRAYGGSVLLTEGEGDALAAATVIESSKVEAFNLCPAGMPGVAAVKAAAAELSAQRIRNAYLALDADEAGRRATLRLRELLPRVGVTPFPISLPDGKDLSEFLLAVGPHALAALISAAKPSPLDPPNIRSQAVRSDYSASERHLKEIPAAVYVSRLAEIEEPDEGRLIHCPLHDERTPSFRVNRNLYHCFGCGAGGDIFSFAMEKWDVGFGEAKERLSEFAGLDGSPQTTPLPSIHA